MNIFFVDSDPDIAAQALCDKHVVKMPLESAQMLCTAHRIIDGDIYADRIGLYKAAYINHPCSVWCRSTRDNYKWLFMHFRALLAEYTHRYGREHKCSALIGALAVVPSKIVDVNFTQPAQAMPDAHRIVNDSVNAYRNYYLYCKGAIAQWNRVPQRMPQWYCFQ